MDTSIFFDRGAYRIIESNEQNKQTKQTNKTNGQRKKMSFLTKRICLDHSGLENEPCPISDQMHREELVIARKKKFLLNL